MLRANLAFFSSGMLRGNVAHHPRGRVALPADLFGVCVASAADPRCDDYVIARLAELQVRCVRVDYSTQSRGTFVDRFVARLRSAGHQVALHLVATKGEIEALDRPEGAERWRRFVRETFERFEGVEFFEIGSTVNRRRWSGFTVPRFLEAWDAAWEEAQARPVVLAGPNVTDFEPFYNVPILRALQRRGRLPAIHTDNLFVERATEPEAYDPKILGAFCAPLIRYNTVKKAALLGAIGRWAGVPRTFSMHVSWSLRRIRRVLEDAEEQQADYVARYCSLAAASGGLQRIYWGPLIGQREGLIDDGTDFFPEVFHVTFYGQANGQVSGYRIRPAFQALQAVVRFLSGTTFVRKIPAGGSLEILEFESAGHTLHAAWCRNGDSAVAADCYTPATLGSAEVFDRAGVAQPTAAGLFSQRPTYLRWAKGTAVQMLPAPGVREGVRLSSRPDVAYAPIDLSEWRGMAAARVDAKPIVPEALLPGSLPGLELAGTEVLRNKRNRVWRVPSPWDARQKLVVKHFRPARGVRGWLQGFKPNKALRSWNGAHELLRRGVPTPRPLAWWEHPRDPRAHESYYICEAFDGASSARQAFYGFNRGEPRFLGMSAADLFQRLAAVLVKMHGRGIFFRDLSAGNMLMRPRPDGTIEFTLIDTGRVRVGTRSLPLRQRLADLMRLCHPLGWSGRELLLRAYADLAGIRLSPWMRLPFHYYDWKHRLKKWVRRR